MDTTRELFHIPDEITAGLRTGQYKRYGGVVRTTGGQIVKHLKPISKEAKKLAGNHKKVAIALGAITLVGTLTLGVVWELTGKKKKQVEARLQRIDQAFSTVVGNGASATMGHEQLEEMYIAVNDFLVLTKEPGYSNVKLMLSNEHRRLLLDFTEALRKFNLQLANDTALEVEPPELIRPLSNEATAILGAMAPQLEYAAQQWPKDTQPLHPDELPEADAER